MVTVVTTCDKPARALGGEPVYPWGAERVGSPGRCSEVVG